MLNVSTKEAQLLEQKLLLMEEERELRLSLPHKYLHPFYKWQREFKDSKKKVALICAANQIGKSASNIIKCITWSTEKALWEELWDIERTGNPNLFWYFYPAQDIINVEFETKWKKYLPAGKMKDDPEYGWEETMRGGDVINIKFKSGVLLEFKSYSQKLINIQTVTLFACFTDEEMPFQYYSELNSRLNATNGYFSMVLTATLGQEEWRCAIEERGDKETFKEALKMNVSLYDCTQYEDGSPGQYTERRIRQIINSYPTDAEIQKRVFGRFVVAEGLIFESFSARKNVVTPYDIPKDWSIRAALDMGSGMQNHKPAIAFIAIRPDRKKAAIFRGWKGDDKHSYTEKDVIEKYIELKKGLTISICYYDHAAKDLSKVAMSYKIPVQKAEKSHEIGEGALNSLFKNEMLDIFDLQELIPLVREATSVKHSTPKHKRDDDLIDCARYLVAPINWCYSDVDDTKIIAKPEVSEREEFREKLKNPPPEHTQDIIAELKEWGSYMDLE